MRMFKRRPADAGFTLIELLVVIAIISVLVGLLLPAVQSARESGRRAACANNLHQISLAMHHFQETHGHMPSSYRPAGETSLPRTSWFTFILPYLEQKALYDGYNQNRSWGDPAIDAGFSTSNKLLVNFRLAVFECASTPNAGRLDGIPENSPWVDDTGAVTDYASITHVDPRLVDLGLVDRAGPGMQPKNSKPKLDDVKDGLSNTLLIVESAGRPNRWVRGKLAGSLPSVRVNGGAWCRPATDFFLKGSSADGDSFPGPHAINRTNGKAVDPAVWPQPEPYGTEGTGETFSFHAGGINAAFGDGSVRFVGEEVEMRVYAALVTRDGGEVVSGSQIP